MTKRKFLGFTIMLFPVIFMVGWEIYRQDWNYLAGLAVAIVFFIGPLWVGLHLIDGR